MAAKANNFSYSELRATTEDFRLANKLGEGGFGPVYKLYFNPATVKMLSNLKYESNAWFVRWSTMCSKLSDQSEAENRVLVDENLITSKGTSMELSLAIVEKLFGCEKALDLTVNENFK
ncbi:cold-responsive protein kinase 1-like isoform X1 [Magnolia sinica]|uniref:cold-responsive protein kinase 1-like isoform X1 n=1 Tax=Magnolia sinica TaxID=86752 RepID=UPI00265852D4|nr:cold-responsive protein kinase 1-like isoform X1 [Magnolia sinica]